MAQDIIEKTLGKVSQNNPMSIEKGSCVTAQNCVFVRDGVAENRRGYYWTYKVSTVDPSSATAKQFLVYQNGHIINTDIGKLICTDVNDTVSIKSGTYLPPTNTKMRSAESNRNLYLTTSAGVKRISDMTTTAAVKAGLDRPTVTTLTYGAAAGGFLATNTGCAYRAVFARYDVWNNLYTSEASLRNVVNNTGAVGNVTVRVYLTSDITTADLVQIYRTSTATIALITDDVAGDEMGLVYQVNPTSTDITNGYIEFTDALVDALRGESLYSNASQQGAAQENGLPPLCKDLALFKGSMCFSNTETKHLLSFSLIATGSLTGKTLKVKNGTVTVTINFGAAEDSATCTAKVFATGIAAYDIAETAKSICKVLNLYASNTIVNAYYVSSSSDLPGKIELSVKTIGDVSFYLEASDTAIKTMFSPQPPTSGPATATTSSNDTRLNGLYVSKSNQPEHVPALNYYLVGANNKQIKRIAALRDSLIILKEDGVYRMVGNGPSDFSITPLDNTVIIKGQDSVAVLGNQVFALTNQGIVSISDSGVVIVSRDIEPDIQHILTYSDLDTWACGVGYEADRHYILSTTELSSDTAFNICYVFNYLTQSWSTWDYGFNAGIVDPYAGNFLFSKTDNTKVYSERKANTDADYQDEEAAVTITALGTDSATITYTGLPKAGDVLEQGTTNVLIDAVEVVTTNTYLVSFTSLTPSDWTTGAANLFPGVNMIIKYHPWHGGNPHGLKQVRSVTYFPDPVGTRSSASSIVATIDSNFDNDSEEVTIVGQSGSWGLSWGETPWGGGGSQIFPTLIPRNKSYCAFLNVGFKHVNARERVAICAVAFNFEGVGDKVGR